jgi:outer membrane protein TolC
VINPDLQHNKQVSGEMINTRRADRDIYKRELVLNIRQAYYQYLQAEKAVDIYNNALNLVKENRRVSEKFVENGKATRESVMRAQAQVSQVESSFIEAKNNLRNAAAYFNFLLNRPLEEPIQADPAVISGLLPVAGGSAAGEAAAVGAASMGGEASVPTGREELARLQSMRKVLESNLRYDRSYIVPKLSAFYDVGFQGFGFHPDGSQFYQLAGLQLQWSLFKAGDNKYKIRQAQVDIASLGDQYRELTQRLTLEVQTTTNNYYSAQEALRSLAVEVSSARETYRFTERRYKEGQALQIELIDSRTQLTSAELRYSVAGLTVLNRAAELERVTAGYKW